MHAPLSPPPPSRDRHAARVARAAAILFLLRLPQQAALLLLELVNLAAQYVRLQPLVHGAAASNAWGCSL